MRCSTIGVLLSAVIATQAVGQDKASVARSNANVSIKLRDGSTIYGRMERRDADSVVIVAASGRMAFAAASVQDVRNAGDAHAKDDGTTEYWFANANSTRLFFGPTGRTLAKGEGYVADHDVLIGSFSVGLSDRVTVGGGGLLIPSSNIWFVTPKVGLVQSESFNLSVGALLGGAGNETGGIAFAAATFGGVDHSASVAVGNAFSGMKAAHSQVVMLGGETRVSRRLALVTENYIFPQAPQPLISYGVRILGEKTSVDLAFFNTLGNGMVFPGIPYVDFVIRF